MSRVAGIPPVAILLWSVTLAAPEPKEPNDDAYFPTEVGAKWVYQFQIDKQAGTTERTEIVTAVEENNGAKLVTVNEIKDDGKDDMMYTIRVSHRGLHLVSTRFSTLKPELCVLRLPFKEASNWEATVTYSSLSSGYETVENRKFTAVALEEVKVPAGKFKAIRLLEKRKSGVLEREYTKWYAPQVGLIKQEYWDGVTDRPLVKVTSVLKSFTPAKKAP